MLYIHIYEHILNVLVNQKFIVKFSTATLFSQLLLRYSLEQLSEYNKNAVFLRSSRRVDTNWVYKVQTEMISYFEREHLSHLPFKIWLRVSILNHKMKY